MKNITFKFSHFIQPQHLAIFASACLLILAALPSLAFAEENAITEINYSSLPGDQVQIRISMENIKLANRSQNIGIGVARSINTVEAGGRTRVVLNLSRLTTYTAIVDGNDIVVTLGASSVASTTSKSSNIVGLSTNDKSIRNIDFRRGEKGEGRVIVELADPNTPVDYK